MVCFFVNNAKLNNSANDSSFKVVIWPPAVVGRVLQNRVCPSFRPSFCRSGRFLEIASLIFSEFSHGARNLYEVVPDKAGFSGKKIFATKIGKIDRKWVKNRVFCIYWKVWSLVFTGFVLKWKFILFAVFLQKFFFLEIWAKMFSAIHIAGFFNQPYFKSRSVKESDFLHVDINSHKLKIDHKIFGWE